MTHYEHGPGCTCDECRRAYPPRRVYKAMFDVRAPRCVMYGRATFVEADDEGTARQLAYAAAQADYAEGTIELYAIGVSTAAARDAFLEQRARLAEWIARARTATAGRGLL